MKAYQLPIDQIIAQLGYGSSSNLFMYDQLQNAPLSLHFKRVLEEIHPYAAYILDDTPFILFFDKLVDDDVSFKIVSRQVWNAQIPVAIFCDESVIRIFNGMSLDISNYTLKQIKTFAIEECRIDSDFSYWQISNPVFWEQYINTYSGTKLNQILLDNISYLTDELKNTYHIQFATKLVLRLIFIRYLIDRGVDLDFQNFSANIERSKTEFLKVVSNKTGIYQLFAHLKTKFNGNLFELGTEIDDKNLTEQVFALLSAFFSGKEIMHSKQLSLFALYDFNIIPVELISNIYEILLGKEAREKDNAFYTPNYLVEYILDKTVTRAIHEKDSFKVLDPSCGSGVFLVDCYRRMIQKKLGNEHYCNDDTCLKELLTNNIFGIDINEEAIDVTIFSLYLTILDYKDPKTLSEFTLPNLKDENLFVSDFFDEKKLEVLSKKNISFDFIIGNPPWGNEKRGLHMSYCKAKGYTNMQLNNEIGRSFVFRAKDFCTVNTTCCFILHSKLLYTQKEPAVRFRKFLLKEAEICNIVELSSVRKLVFENADAPATIITFRYNGQSNLNHNILYTSIKPNIFFKLFHVICIERHDVKNVSQSLLYNYDWVWKLMVYGYSHDIDTIVKLKGRYHSISSYLKSATPPLIFGSGVQDHVGDAQDASDLMGLPLLDSDYGVDHFSLYLDNNNVFCKPRIHRIRNRELFNPPHCFTAKGLNCDNYKMRSVYSDSEAVCKETMYVIKGTDEQKDILFNLVGLFNSSLFAYLNLMLGSSAGIEREQRFMREVLSFPYTFSRQIVQKVKSIQASREALFSFENNAEVEDLDGIVLESFGLKDDVFVNYAINITIPELTGKKTDFVYNKVTTEDLIKFSKCFEKYFSTIYNECGKYVSIVLYPSIGSHYAVFELRIEDDTPTSVITIVGEADDDKELFTKFSMYAYNDKFYQIRDVIHFDENSFFIIKPNILKNWHPAIAELDLVDVVEQIMSSLGDEK